MKLYEKQKQELEQETGNSDDAKQKERLEKFLKSEGKLVGSLPMGAESSIKKTSEEKKTISGWTDI